MPNLLHFLPDLGALYALRHAPNFYEIQLKSLGIYVYNVNNSLARDPCYPAVVMLN
jgi:hypothetical protein